VTEKNVGIRFMGVMRCRRWCQPRGAVAE